MLLMMMMISTTALHSNGSLLLNCVTTLPCEKR